MVKPKLKFTLRKRGRALEFQVLDQSPLFWNNREKSGKYPWFTAANGFAVASISHPELGDDVVFLRGSSPDSKTVVRWFSDTPSCDKYYSDLLFAIEEWANRAPEFQSAPPQLILRFGIFSI